MMSVVHLRLEQSPDERPPHDVIYFIHESDTFFVGTCYNAEEEVYKRFPSHVGMNHRGGKAGFARVRPSNGRTLSFQTTQVSHCLSTYSSIS
jgi:hypothetical protein